MTGHIVSTMLTLTAVTIMTITPTIAITVIFIFLHPVLFTVSTIKPLIASIKIMPISFGIIMT